MKNPTNHPGAILSSSQKHIHFISKKPGWVEGSKKPRAITGPQMKNFSCRIQSCVHRNSQESGVMKNHMKICLMGWIGFPKNANPSFYKWNNSFNIVPSPLVVYSLPKEVAHGSVVFECPRAGFHLDL